MLRKCLNIILQMEYLSCVSDIPRSARKGETEEEIFHMATFHEIYDLGELVGDFTDFDAIEGSNSAFWDFLVWKECLLVNLNLLRGLVKDSGTHYIHLCNCHYVIHTTTV